MNPSVGIDDIGNAIVVWSGYNGSYYQIQSTQYKYITDSWLAVEVLSSASVHGIYPDVAVNSLGQAIATWAEFDGTNLEVFSSSLISSIWDVPTLISDTNYISQFPNTLIDSLGNGSCIWTASDGSDQRIKASLKDILLGWQTPIYISDSGKVAYKSLSVCDSSGNIVCAWIGKEGSDIALYACSYDGSSWSSPQILSEAGSSVSSFNLKINATGNAIIAWQSSSNSLKTIKVSKASFL